MNLSREQQEVVTEMLREMSASNLPQGSGLKTLSMAQLYDMAFPPRTPVIDGLLFSGTYIFAGSPKIGKSFFMTQLSYHVATGQSLWNYPVRKGSVLYLALEDDYARLQSRLNRMFGVNAVDGLFFAVQAKTISDGLYGQMEEFVGEHPDTRLIIVDTLQKVREFGTDAFSYSMDYQTITAIKQFSDRHNLAVIVVHHTRKMEANDSFDMISGTNGLLGAADGAFIMLKKKRTDNTAVMQVVGRDQQDQSLALQFDHEHCVWKLTKAENEIYKRPVDPFVLEIATFMSGRASWEGSASELLESIPKLDMKPNVVTRKLNVNTSTLLNDFGIIYHLNQRVSDKRTFILCHKSDPQTAETADSDPE